MGSSKKAKKKSKNNAKKRDKPGASNRAERDRAAGDREISKALRQVEDARDELAKREQKLSALLAKHGRAAQSNMQPPATNRTEPANTPESTAEVAASAIDAANGEAGAEDATELLQQAFERRE